VGDSLSWGEAHGIVAGSTVARHGEGVCESGGVVSGGRNFGGWLLVFGVWDGAMTSGWIS
jgi:hypothetical protein